jgi:hypothetical protein
MAVGIMIDDYPVFFSGPDWGTAALRTLTLAVYLDSVLHYVCFTLGHSAPPGFTRMYI